MKKDLTLLVLAAGMGSRFGGLKQIEPVGPNGEFIIDYSIKDAIMVGFNKVVFVIKEENYEIFKSTIGKHIEDKIKVEYVFQDNKNVPEGINIPKDRLKPLGTAHALYSAKDVIKENFAVINADDFYGREGLKEAANYLLNCEDDEYAIICYKVGNTLSENGSVKRGVIFENNGYLNKLVESEVYLQDDKIMARPLDKEEAFEINFDTLVSMNLFCLTPKIFPYLEKSIKDFFLNNDLATTEWLAPNVVFESAKEMNKKVKVIKTNSKHYGITYKEDLGSLKRGIQKEIEVGTYKKDLWG